MFLLQRLSIVRIRAADEDYELKQMKDMAAARKRWEALVFSHFEFTCSMYNCVCGRLNEDWMVIVYYCIDGTNPSL